MKRRLIVPEVVQTSNMDCGPAALKSILEGFGVRVNYGRLREACQTDVDGASIDTLEEIANQLGLQAEQIMLPVDFVPIDEARALPAIAIVVLPSGVTHFVVVWRRFGQFIELMDPSLGRRWIGVKRFLSSLYVHEQIVPAEQWREYAGSEDFLAPLRRRMDSIGIRDDRLLRASLEDASWRSLAALDAAVRMTASLVETSVIDRGEESLRVLSEFLNHASAIPDHYWFVRPTSEPSELIMRGAVLVRAVGLAESTVSSPELSAALHQFTSRPGMELLGFLKADGVFTPAAIIAALALSSAAVIVEAILFRGLFDIVPSLASSALRIGAMSLIIAFAGVLLLLEIPLTQSLLRLGRRLEIRLRVAFLEKLPRLGDRYFQSRPKSDMAERSHSIHQIRRLPELGGQLLRYSFEIVFTASAIVWLDPASALIAIAAACAALIIPLASQPLLVERDLRVRTHAGALTRFYLDALLGLIAIHAHGGQPAMRREHESLLSEWARAGLSLQRAVLSLETLQFLLGFGLAIWLLASHLARNADAGAVLLLVYWALNLSALGQEIALIAWQYPSYRNITLRLLEPLGALDQKMPQHAPQVSPRSQAGALSITFEGVSVVAAGHTVLKDVTASVRAGEHIAIVGASGAGKSSLVGLLLGWYRAASGKILIDGAEFDDSHLDELRPHIAWVDPAVQLWNRPLAQNVRYGSPDGLSAPLDAVFDAAELRPLIDRLPNGFDTPLGEGGGLVSGGEGQRVRFARALMRPDVRLAILDEPFRGLDFEQRHKLLARAREAWRGATVLAISHDIQEAMTFPRVLVLDESRIVEDGDPRDLARDPDSRFSAMLRAESFVRDEIWSGARWSHVCLHDGQLTS